MTMMMFTTALFAVLAPSFVAAFVGPAPSTTNVRGSHAQQQNLPLPRSPSTRIFLEDWVADMIDNELWRQGHKKDFETAWMEKNRAAVVQSLGSASSMTAVVEDDPAEAFRQHARDARMAKEDPQRYCADRCIATGNCDVYEDFFRMSAQQVIEFCSDCVISDGEEPCDIPESFYDDGNDGGRLQP